MRTDEVDQGGLLVRGNPGDGRFLGSGGDAEKFCEVIGGRGGHPNRLEGGGEGEEEGV